MRATLFLALFASTFANTAAEAHPITANEFLSITQIDATCSSRYPEPSYVARVIYGAQPVLDRRQKIAACVRNEMAKINLRGFIILPAAKN